MEELYNKYKQGCLTALDKVSLFKDDEIDMTLFVKSSIEGIYEFDVYKDIFGSSWLLYNPKDTTAGLRYYLRVNDGPSISLSINPAGLKTSPTPLSVLVLDVFYKIEKALFENNKPR